MASGRFHGMVSIGAGVLAGGTLYYLTQDKAAAAALGGACMAGVIITPDLDEPNPSHSHYEVWHGCGAIFAMLWWLFWLPYTLIVTRHRSLMSHFPILSTIGRVGYLGTIMLPILWLIKSTGGITLVIQKLANANWGIGILPIREWISPLLSVSIPIPGVEWWVVFTIIVLTFAGLSILKVDLPQNMQISLFCAMTSAFLGIGVILKLVISAYGFASQIHVPIWGWLFTGLCLSDTLHALVDWVINRNAPIWI